MAQYFNRALLTLLIALLYGITMKALNDGQLLLGAIIAFCAASINLFISKDLKL